MKAIFTLLLSMLCFSSTIFSQSPVKKPVGPVNGLVPEGMTTSRDGNGFLGNIYNDSKVGLDFVQASKQLGQRFTPPGDQQPATFTISGIPNNAVIEQAYLWCALSGSGVPVMSVITNPNSTTQNFPMTIIGSGLDKCWGYQGTYNYRADVTSVIAGNGNYLVSGLPTNPPDTSDDTDGATLLIIYSDPSENFTGGLVINDGCIVVLGGNASQTLTGFNLSNTTNAMGFIVTADLQLSYTVWLDGWSAPGSWEWYDYDRVYAILDPWDTSVDFSIDGTNDCYDWMVMGLYYPREPPIGIAEANSSTQEFRLFPNPTDGKFSILYPGYSQQLIEVHDLLGNLVLTTKQQQVDLSGYPIGIYVVSVGEWTEKLVLSE